ncbi:hypothetical protein MUK42_25054 [Musa troglodytarum]|uniref:TFIIS N-terminal domain-containing protein n=1 Tax=Musa troglodytarum TaxID=320322 RepID=A0A9E7J9A0_9LILI|nr:hypothetical protein MUK42_25054 [Musa troglodytarum]
MASSSGSVDYWRRFFRSANSDIFEVIEQAILVAASDYPQHFRSRRDQIVEKFSPRFCRGASAVTGSSCEGRGEEGHGSVRRSEKESKVDSSNDGPEFSNPVVSNYTYDEAEALTEEMEEEGQIVGEVMRIKEILANHHEQSDNFLFESLRRLQLMGLSVDVLKATEIGRAVNGLRKHNSKQIRHLVRALIDGWKVLVDEWVSATAAIADNSPDSVNPSVVDDEDGLPSPPLDEGALFATQTTSIQLSKFFDGMDDDGNFQNNGEFDKRREHGRRPTENHESLRKQQPMQQPFTREGKVEMKQDPEQSIFAEGVGYSRRQEPHRSATPEEKLRRQEPQMRQSKPHEICIGQAKSQNILHKQSNPVISESGPGRPVKLAFEQKVCNKAKIKQPPDTAALQRKPPMIPRDKSKYIEEAPVQAKLEATKRKLHEGYQQAENGLFNFNILPQILFKKLDFINASCFI